MLVKFFKMSVLLLCLLPGILLAEETDLPSPYDITATDLFSGLYIGAQLGMVNWLAVESNSATLISTGGSLHFPPINNQAIDFNAAGGFHIGYGWELARYYLGDELYVTYQSNAAKNNLGGRVNNSSLNAQISIKTQTELGSDLRAGILLTPNV